MTQSLRPQSIRLAANHGARTSSSGISFRNYHSESGPAFRLRTRLQGIQPKWFVRPIVSLPKNCDALDVHRLQFGCLPGNRIAVRERLDVEENRRTMNR